MKNEIQIFKSKAFGTIRTMVNEAGETYFIAKDVAQALGYKNPQKALRDHVDVEDRTVNDSFTVNGTSPIIINESGLMLVSAGIQFWNGSRYKLTAKYAEQGLAQDRMFHYFGLGGVKKQRPYLVWTAAGVDFIKGMLNAELGMRNAECEGLHQGNAECGMLNAEMRSIRRSQCGMLNEECEGLNRSLR